MPCLDLKGHFIVATTNEQELTEKNYSETRGIKNCQTHLKTAKLGKLINNRNEGWPETVRTNYFNQTTTQMLLKKLFIRY